MKIGLAGTLCIIVSMTVLSACGGGGGGGGNRVQPPPPPPLPVSNWDAMVWDQDNWE